MEGDVWLGRVKRRQCRISARCMGGGGVWALIRRFVLDKVMRCGR